MTTWEHFLDEGLEDETGGTPEDLAEDLHDTAADLEAAEMEAILAGDVEAAESLHDQAEATEEAADHADWAAQELEWARQSSVEAEIDATDAAEAASMDLPESAEKIAGMAGIASEAAGAAVDEALVEFEQSAAYLAEADAVDEATEADEPYEPYDADADLGTDLDGGDDLDDDAL